MTRTTRYDGGSVVVLLPSSIDSSERRQIFRIALKTTIKWDTVHGVYWVLLGVTKDSSEPDYLSRALDASMANGVRYFWHGVERYFKQPLRYGFSFQ